MVICSVNGRRDREDLSPVRSMKKRKEEEEVKRKERKGKGRGDNEREGEGKSGGRGCGGSETKSDRTRKPVYTRRVATREMPDRS